MAIKCQDWYDACGNELTISCDTFLNCQVGFFNESPSVLPEDIWSLQLEAGFFSDGFAETYITGQSGTQIYQLEYWMKSPNWTGSASLGTGTQNQFTASHTLSDTTSTWKQYSFIDTLTTQTSDTIAVRLSAGTGDFCVCTSYFDFIVLTVTDTLTSIEGIAPFKKIDIKVYPNPSQERISFEIIDGQNENYWLTVHNSSGQLIKTIKTHTNTITFNHRDIESGLYYYQIQSITSLEIIGQGKFVIE